MIQLSLSKTRDDSRTSEVIKINGCSSSIVFTYNLHTSTHVLLIISRLLIGEGNGTPLRYSCLENPMDGGAWKAAVHGGHWGSDTTERLPFHFSLSCVGEGNGNPLQCSCLENLRDGGSLGQHWCQLRGWGKVSAVNLRRDRPLVIQEQAMKHPKCQIVLFLGDRKEPTFTIAILQIRKLRLGRLSDSPKWLHSQWQSWDSKDL